MQTAKPAQLKPETLKVFDAYVQSAETGMEQTLHTDGVFLWADLEEARLKSVRDGKVVAQFWSGTGPVKVPDGLIHDWIGAAFIVGTTVEETLALIQDYDNHKNIYRSEVIASALISHHNYDFQIYLRLPKDDVVFLLCHIEKSALCFHKTGCSLDGQFGQNCQGRVQEDQESR